MMLDDHQLTFLKISCELIIQESFVLAMFMLLALWLPALHLVIRFSFISFR